MRRTMHIPETIYQHCEKVATMQRKETGKSITWQAMLKYYVLRGMEEEGWAIDKKEWEFDEEKS